MKETVNKLKYKIRTQTKDGNNIEIEISLDDDCKNGHNDFSITASVYQAPHWNGGNRDQFFISGGCCHDDILAARPNLKIFVDLHLADVNGAPMHAIENGFYHLSKGFNNTKPNDPSFKTEYCDYYRLNEKQFDILSTSEDKTVFAYYLSKLGIVAQWKKQANEAIVLLEEWTEEKFKDDSTKLPNVELTTPEFKRMDLKINSGHYNPVNIKKRADDKAKAEKQKLFDDIKKELNTVILKETQEYNVKFAVLSFGLSLDNFIYYNHTNEGQFNWLDYKSKITKEQLTKFNEWLNTFEIDPKTGRKFKTPLENLPIGIVFKLK